MIRCFLSFVVVALCFVQALSAQEASPEVPRLKTTPGVLALLDQMKQTIGEQETPDERALMLFQLLTFQLRLEDRKPVRETIQTILKSVPEFQQETAKIHLLEAVAVAQAEIGNYGDAEKTLALIPRVAERAETRLHVAEMILEQRETQQAENLFDVSGLLRAAVEGAVEAKDPGLEALASALLARELARQGKNDEAKTFFARARLRSRELEQIEERNVVALIVRSQILCGMQSEALATIATVPLEETKQSLFGFAALTLAREGKTEEADQILRRVVQPEARDNALIGMARESIQTIEIDRLQKLADQMSPPRKERYFQSVIQGLMEADRFEVAAELAKGTENPAELTAMMELSRIEKTLRDNKFDEAEKLIAGLKNERWRQAASRHLALARMKSGDVEAVRTQAEASLSAEEKSRIALLAKEKTEIANIGDPDERMSLYFAVLESQFSLFDLRGSKETIATMLADIEKSKDPVKKISYYLALSRIQSELSDQSGARETLGHLVKFLAGIKDVTTLEGLVSEDQPDSEAADEGNEPQPVVRLARPVDEAAIKDRLFEVYVTIGNGQGRAGDVAGATESFDKARQLVESETDAGKKFEKLFILTQAVAESSE